MSTNGDGCLWRWVAVTLAAVMVSNVATALAFRVSSSDIKMAMEEHFTNLSIARGMYVIEGRPRLDRLEKENETILDFMGRIETRLIRLEQMSRQKMTKPPGDPTR